MPFADLTGIPPENAPWRCNVCGWVNRSQRTHCYGCDRTCPNANTSETRLWICSSCSAINAHTSGECENCSYCCNLCNSSRIRPDHPDSRCHWTSINVNPTFAYEQEILDNPDDYDERDDYEPTGDFYNNETNQGVHNYSYKPRPNFHGMSDSNLFLGFELEVNIPSNSSRRMNKCVELANNALGSMGYLKEDGSIPYGFELVTHPMTYQFAMESFPWSLLSDLEQNGAENHEDCGMHVHVSRRGFSGSLHNYRWLKFIYRNRDGVRGISRRASHWGDFQPEMRKAAKHLAKGSNLTTGQLYDNFGNRNRNYEYVPNERYSAVNCQNLETFEIRTFKSSLNIQEVQAALGLSDASVEYTRKLTAHDILHKDGWSWHSFQKWLTPKYQPLMNEMNKFHI